MRAKVIGNVVELSSSQDGKYLDVTLLQAPATVLRLFAFADAPGADKLAVGDEVEATVWASAKMSKRGREYLSVQLREVEPAPVKAAKAA